MAKKKHQPATSETIYQIKITLQYSKPPIWRRLHIRDDMPLDLLHRIIQIAMPWTDSHLHQFNVGGHYRGVTFTDPQFQLEGHLEHEAAKVKAYLDQIGFDPRLWKEATESKESKDMASLLAGRFGSDRLPDDFSFVFLSPMDERQAILRQIATRTGAKIDYEYDFGDSWWHEILLEKILPAEPGQIYPVCIKGKRAAPPDDSGGIYSYDSFVEAITNPRHPDHKELLSWYGGPFDPEAFDIDAVNGELRRLSA